MPNFINARCHYWGNCGNCRKGQGARGQQRYKQLQEREQQVQRQIHAQSRTSHSTRASKRRTFSDTKTRADDIRWPVVAGYHGVDVARSLYAD